MRKLSFVFFAICILSCKHKPKYNPEAVKLNNLAVKLFMQSVDSNNKQNAINLLNKATAIDSNYFTAYWNKLSFQMGLKQYDNALITARRITVIRPNNAYVQAMVGNLLEIKGDSISSKPNFNASLLLYNKMLDTINVKDSRYKDVVFGKATDLIMLGKQSEANILLKQLYNSTTDTVYRQMYMQYIGKDRKTTIEGLMKPDTVSTSAK